MNGTSSPDSDHPGRATQGRGKASLSRRVRNYFLAGVLVTAPISITLLAAWTILDYIDDFITDLIPAPYNPMTYLPVAVPGLGIALLITAVTLIGFLTANFLGRILIGWGERLVERMPIVRSIYGALKQIFETVLSDKTKSFQEVVLLEYPRREMWTLGFVIGKTYGEVQDRTSEEMLNVYIPTTPNPTSGYLVFLARKELTTLNMTVEDALKMVISGGIVTPPSPEGEPEAVNSSESEGSL
jgi:uncharacterized membrane protein